MYFEITNLSSNLDIAAVEFAVDARHEMCRCSDYRPVASARDAANISQRGRYGKIGRP